MIIFLDTSILGKLSNPNPNPDAIQCQIWFERLLARGVYFASSELCFYELKRSLILSVKRGNSSEGLKKANNLRQFINVLQIDEDVADLAAEIWSISRLQGTPTADEKLLDIDIIIAAHWQLLTEKFPGRYVVVSTTNVKHLRLFTEAEEWQNIY
ncbi:PIN domain-containing protein [Aphanothece sacrum]|uniref:PIN domain protein n=1 Tax=Aphanothece sacrum FPU1 TaxID=1920663 RepID=A0A401IEM9_APHSA|nr:PIN domain-containing protein [Aphanothece sacrum]GBF79728.1 PIN domain protein [Aphanothece sacrum FPU1]GBF85740.1 PIN domain protein [Aphanothece sacrum FPU3]